MILNPQQELAANAIDGVWVTIAGPGSGKTTVLVERYIRMLTRGINTRDILNLTFTNAAAEQMQTRIGMTDAKSSFRTFHSFALEVLKKEREHLPFELCDEIIPVKAQDYQLLAELCRQFPQLQYKTLREKITRWKCENTDPATAMEEARHQGAEYVYSLAYEQYEKGMRLEGWLDFDACITEVVKLFETNLEVLARWKRKYIAVDEAQDTDEKQFRLLQLIFDGNMFAVGDENQCQPPGTLVDVLVSPVQGRVAAKVKQVPIELLSETNDRIVSWDHYGKRMRLGKGRRFRRAVRQFDGNLLQIEMNNETTKVTPNHFVWTKFNRKALQNKTHFVYLMWRRDRGFRIGTSTLRTACGGNQISHRGYQERADKMWILDVVESNTEAHTREEIYSLQYQIPERTFHNYRTAVTGQQIKRVFKSVSWAGGFNLLLEKGLLFEYPLISWGNRKKHRTKFHGYFKTVAANLLEKLMDLPTKKTYKSSLIQKIKKIKYCGPVYSLDVEKDHTYIADNVPVGNCIYEWRSAQAGNLSKFYERFPNAKTLYLGQNYRSTKKLVEFFKEILPVDNGIASHMTTDNEVGVDPTVVEYSYDLQEADRVLSKITDPEHTAILARTNRQLFAFQKACTSRNIRYKYLGKDGFWQQSEVKRLLKLAKESNDTRPANEVLADLITKHNLIWIYRNLADAENDPVKNLNDAVRMSANKGNVTEFLNYLRRLAYATKAIKCLTLATVHKAKGLEFDYVFLVGCSQGKIPHKNGEIMEEKRIFFVGASRAAKHLELSYFGPRSEFLNNYIDRIQVYEEEYAI